jgi:amino acid transporter
MENERSLQLDSKANTYIGLLSIAVTIFGVLGGLLTVENIKLLKTFNFNIILFMYIIYMLIIIFFIIGVLFAFKAYHTGSPLVKDSNDSQKMKKLIDSGRVFVKLNPDTVYDLLNRRSQKNDLISQLLFILKINRNLNIEKSTGILWSFRITIVAILLLLVMTIYIGVVSVWTLR